MDNHLYLLVCKDRKREDAVAAMELVKEFYGAQCRGSAPFGMGLVYTTDKEIPESDRKVLGIVSFI